ncbi:MAG: hypothetical protein FWG30_10270 [Eubacteriaceae bacterium]|jgi:hypothetical protein|nr:hypothetical protein [Eubacteriaceae bacterium]
MASDNENNGFEAKDEVKDKFDDVVEKSKEFTDSIMKKASEFAQMLSDRTNQATGSARRKFEAEKLQASLYKKYRELGRAYYSKAKGADNSLETESIIIEIDTILATIDELEKEEPIAMQESDEDIDFGDVADEIADLADDISDIVDGIIDEIADKGDDE